MNKRLISKHETKIKKIKKNKTIDGGSTSKSF